MSLVDLIGIEPMTSSMPFPGSNKYRQALRSIERHGEAVFMPSNPRP